MPEVGEVKNEPFEINIIEWKIPDFFSIIKEPNYIRYTSPSFSIKGMLLHLRLYPQRENVILYFGTKMARKYSIEYSFGLKKNNACSEWLVNSYLDKDKECGNQTIVLIKTTELFRRKSELVPSDDLNIRCMLKVLIEENHSSQTKPMKLINDVATAQCSFCEKIVNADNLALHQKKDKLVKCLDCSNVITLKNWYDHECQMQNTKDKCYLSGSLKILQDFKELFLKQIECDVVIKVKNQKFSVHKAVLIARSSVFESTFRSDMKEKRSGTIDIEDCDPTSFSDFLCFLYCGDSENMSHKNVFNLFVTAGKYNVMDLKEQCIEFIKNNLSVDIFCDAISLALQYSEAELIKQATDFFAKNLQKIIVTVKWQLFLAENPTWSNELLIKALINEKQSDA